MLDAPTLRPAYIMACMDAQVPITVSARALWFRASVALGVALSALALHATAGYAGEPSALAGARAAAPPAGPAGNRTEAVAAQATSSSVPHVMLIMEENRNRSEVIGSAEMPYFNSLASKYVDTTAWEGVGPSSLSDYLAVISGSTEGVTENPFEITFPGVPTLPSQLSEAGVPWKAYIEDLPGVASEVGESGEYARRHNPFPYFPSINGPTVVPGSQFASDLKESKLPPFVWYTPNLIDDGEDGKNPEVDHSLESIIPAVQESAWYKEGGVIIITWDEGNLLPGVIPNVIPTVVVSGEGTGTSFTASGNHYGTLAAIENLYGLPLLGNAAHATPLLIPGATQKATVPTVETKTASGVGQTTATLNASVNPNGGEVTECKLEYGTTNAYGLTAACTPSPGSGTSPVAVSTSLELLSLSEDTTYHFRISATNPGGTRTGADGTFKTLPNPPAVVTNPPAVVTLLSAVGVLGSQEQGTPPTPDAELASRSVAASSSGTISVKVSCPAGESSCTGTLTLRTLNAVRTPTANQSKKGKAAILTLAAGPFRVAGGHATTMRLHLSGNARTLLARTPVLRARATIVAHDPVGAIHTTQTIVTVRTTKARHGR
jgi:hypothetical protein